MFKKRKINWLWIWILVIALSSVPMTVKASYLDKRVLFISSYSYSWTTVQKQIKGITSVLREDVTLNYEFLDCRRLYDETTVENFYDGVKYRLENEKPYDVVIVGDDQALDFVLKYQTELFKDIPILFLGAQDEGLVYEATDETMISGFVENVFPEENIKLALKMRPKAKRAYAILDDSITGLAEQKLFLECQDEFPGLEFVVIDTTKLTDIMLAITVRNIDANDILFYFSATNDSGGNQYSSGKIIELLRDNSKTPVIPMVDVGIGDGFAGGYVSSMEETGKRVAKMAEDIMQGHRIEQMEVVTDGPSMYIVDEAILKKYGVDLNVIPQGAHILNETPSYYERNKEVLLPVMVLITAMMAIIYIMYVDKVKYKKLVEELEEARSILKNASQHDFLTGLANRSKFMEDFENLIAEKQHCTVIMMDIDNFKSINDTYGHGAGDEALQQVAARLKALQTPILTAYRYAGDEFIIILKSTQSRIMDKTSLACRQVFEKCFLIAGQKMYISGSMGGACYPKDADDLEHVVIYADEAMYDVKRNGKNGIEFYEKKQQEEENSTEE